MGLLHAGAGLYDRIRCPPHRAGPCSEHSLLLKQPDFKGGIRPLAEIVMLIFNLVAVVPAIEYMVFRVSPGVERKRAPLS